MWRWILVVLIVLLVLQGVMPWLRRLGIGRLPGDLNFRVMGKAVSLPITSTLILSAVCAVLAKYL